IRLDVRGEILGEGNGRPLAVAGRSDRSRLLDAVRGKVADKIMQPEGRGKRLTPEQIETLRAWLDGGLPWADRRLPPPEPPASRRGASAGRGSGWSWRVTTSRGATRATTCGRTPGATATGWGGRSTPTCPSPPSPACRWPATRCGRTPTTT